MRRHQCNPTYWTFWAWVYGGCAFGAAVAFICR